jgi:hypothetical protein
MRRWALTGVLAAAAVLLVAMLTMGRPYLTKARHYPASIPQPPSVVSVELVRVKPGQRACLHDAAIDTHSDVALFQVETHGRPTVPLRLVLSGEGYRSAASIPSSGYRDEGIVRVPVRPPDHDVLATACIANAGRHSIELFSTTFAERSAAYATVGSKAITTNPWLAFYEAKPVSIAHRLPTIFERMGAFRPPFLGAWLFWPLGLLFVFGLPVAVIVGYGRALSGEPDA